MMWRVCFTLCGDGEEESAVVDNVHVETLAKEPPSTTINPVNIDKRLCNSPNSIDSNLADISTCVKISTLAAVAVAEETVGSKELLEKNLVIPSETGKPPISPIKLSLPNKNTNSSHVASQKVSAKIESHKVKPSADVKNLKIEPEKTSIVKELNVVSYADSGKTTKQTKIPIKQIETPERDSVKPHIVPHKPEVHENAHKKFSTFGGILENVPLANLSPKKNASIASVKEESPKAADKSSTVIEVVEPNEKASYTQTEETVTIKNLSPKKNASILSVKSENPKKVFNSTVVKKDIQPVLKASSTELPMNNENLEKVTPTNLSPKKNVSFMLVKPEDSKEFESTIVKADIVLVIEESLPQSSKENKTLGSLKNLSPKKNVSFSLVEPEAVKAVDDDNFDHISVTSDENSMEDTEVSVETKETDSATPAEDKSLASAPPRVQILLQEEVQNYNGDSLDSMLLKSNVEVSSSPAISVLHTVHEDSEDSNAETLNWNALSSRSTHIDSFQPHQVIAENPLVIPEDEEVYRDIKDLSVNTDIREPATPIYMNGSEPLTPMETPSRMRGGRRFSATKIMSNIRKHRPSLSMSHENSIRTSISQAPSTAASRNSSPGHARVSLEEALRKGIPLAKKGRNGVVATRMFTATPGLKTIGWGNKSFSMSDCLGVIRDDEYGGRNFSLKFNNRTLDITAESEEQAEEMVAGFRAVLKGLNAGY